MKSVTEDSLGYSESKGTRKNGKESDNKSDMHKKVPGLSEVILATRVNNCVISNNHNRSPKLQSRLNTVRNASSKSKTDPKKPKRPPGRPHGSLTNMTQAKLERKAKLSRLANNFELKNPKGGPKYHEVSRNKKNAITWFLGIFWYDCQSHWFKWPKVSMLLLLKTVYGSSNGPFSY